MSTLFVNGSVLTPKGLIDDLTVLVEAGRIKNISPAKNTHPHTAIIHDLNGQMMLPGFIDTQVNGGGSVLFNDDPSVECITKIANAHRQFGTTGLLPTLISDELSVVRKALKAVDQAIEQGVNSVLGIHIEGPFLNPERRGVHDQSKLVKLDLDILNTLEPLRNGKTLITLAPEMVSHSAIERLVAKGFIVSIGHSNAKYAQALSALDSGATGFTHLFNAMSQLNSREPGVVGAALDDDRSWCGIIADGHHVSPSSLRIALKSKPRSKVMLVTDAMSPVGSEQTQFQLLDKQITVSNGICLDQNNTLAGTALCMNKAVANTMEMAALDLLTAVQFASINPACFLGIDHETGSLEPGKRADFVIADSQLNITMVYQAGEQTYQSRNNDSDSLPGQEVHQEIANTR